MTSTASLDAALSRLLEDVGELVESHRGESAPTDRRNFTRYANDPAGFIREVLRGDPWVRQVEIAEAVRDHSMVAVRSANGIGKDWLSAALLLWWTYARQGLAIGQAPTDRQGVEIIGGEMRRHFQRGQLPGELFRRALRTSHPHAGVLLMTSNEADKLTGFHSPRVLVLLSEAQGLDSFVYDAAMAVAVGTEDRILAVGNPLRPAGRFYLASRPASQWRAIQVSALEHPNVVEGRTLIPGAVTRTAVERARKEWGETSGQYAARVLGEFPRDNEEGLVSRAQLEASAERWQAAAVAPRSAEPVEAALDVARGGPDKSCLGLKQGRTVLGFTVWGKLDTMETAEKTLAVLKAERCPMYRPAELLYLPLGGRYCRRVTIDTVGVGSGVYDRLRQLGYPVVEFNGSVTPVGPQDAGRFENLRARAYWSIREGLEAGTLNLPPDELLFEELLATQWTVKPASGKIQIVGKDEIRSLLGRSPDRADTLSMLMGPSPGVRFTSTPIRWLT